jgi:DNA-binding NarL/FixJ family response regulator
MQSGMKAARSLKNEEADSVISNWDLEDMADGLFLARLRAVKPDIPTIAFVQPGNKRQEIAARSLGVSAVLTEDVDDDYFRQTVAAVLGLADVASIRQISATKNARSGQRVTG